MSQRFFAGIAALSLLFSAPAAHAAACTQTVSSAAALSTAVTAATAGSVICLADGDYGSVNFNGLSKTGMVTIRSASGLGARLSPQITGSNRLRFESLTLYSAAILACSKNIQIVGNTWVTDTAGIVVMDHGYGCDSTNKQNLIDGNTFKTTRPAWSEGKIGIVSTNGLTISNNLIEGQSANNGGDGIQSGGNNDNIVIGPGNIFRDIKQGPCDSTPGVPHCDAIQIVGGAPTYIITGNWFDNVEVPLQHHDGPAPVQFNNNLITGGAQFWAYEDNAAGSIIEHNTFYKQNHMSFGQNGSGVSDSSGIVVRSNIFISGAEPKLCEGCTASHNIGGTSGEALGTNSITGTPKFVGGTPGSITSWAGWRLESDSIGKSNGHDGKDRGANYFPATGGSNAAPSAPSNLTVGAN